MDLLSVDMAMTMAKRGGVAHRQDSYRIRTACRLAETDRAHLRELAAFVGSFSLEAAEAACDDAGILDGIARLIDASLVVADPDVAEPRYRMLDTIRELASELARATPEHDVVLRRHAEYFTRFAEAADAGLRGRDQSAWYTRVDRDQGNLRAALAYLLRTGDCERAMRLGGSVWLFWQSRGDYDVGHALEDAAARGSDAPFALRASARFGAAWLAFRRGDFARATVLHRELLADALAAGDDITARNALTVAAHVELATGAAAPAVASFERCVELTRERGPSWHLAMSLLNLGVGLLHARDLEAARRRLGEARDMHAAIGDEIFAARATAYIGYAALLAGDVAGAEDHFTASMRAASASSDNAGVAEGLAGLAAVRSVQGRHADAACLAGAHDAVRARTGWRPLPADRALWLHYFDVSRRALGDAAWNEAVAAGRRSG
jgi:tetratricopeptide (TPR) repeat protein